MPESKVSVTVGDTAIGAVRAEPVGEPRPLQFIYAPGAGSTINDGFGVFVCHELAARGYETWRFQFPYMEAGKKGPNRPPVLEATWRAVMEAASVSGRSIVAGGRSMGGRIASQVVAAGGSPVRGLALFAYPLIPPGRDRAPRSEHLGRIDVPTLFCSGTRDSFGTPEQLAAAAALAPRSRLHLMDGADHGFNVLRSAGRTREDIWREALDALIEFLREVESGG